MAVGREAPFVRDDPGDDVELEAVVRLALLDERPRLRDAPKKREGRDACSPAVPVALEAAVDDERPVLFGSRIDKVERNLALFAHPP